MTANKQPMPLGFDEDAPDLSAPECAAKLASTPVARGRPKAAKTKIPTSLRLDPEVLEHFKAEGRGWQSRMNAALRKAAGL